MASAKLIGDKLVCQDDSGITQQIISAANNTLTTVWCDEMYLSNPVTKCLSLMGSAKLPASGGPTQVVFQSYWIGWGFAPSLGVYLYNSVLVPSDWEIGTPLTVDISWCPDSTNTGNVNWGIDYQIVDFTGQVISSSPVWSAVTVSAPGVAYQTCDAVVTVPAINASAVTTPNPLIFIRIDRGNADTFTGNAILCAWNLRYQSRNL